MTPCPNASTVAAEAPAPARRRELERVNAEEVHIDRYARQVRRSTPSRDGAARGPGAGRSVLPTRAARGGDSGGERPRDRGRSSRSSQHGCKRRARLQCLESAHGITLGDTNATFARSGGAPAAAGVWQTPFNTSVGDKLRS